MGDWANSISSVVKSVGDAFSQSIQAFNAPSGVRVGAVAPAPAPPQTSSAGVFGGFNFSSLIPILLLGIGALVVYKLASR